MGETLSDHQSDQRLFARMVSATCPHRFICVRDKMFDICFYIYAQELAHCNVNVCMSLVFWYVSVLRHNRNRWCEAKVSNSLVWT